jgi:zinc-binding alcohol dehydrogenase family protein
MKAIGYQQSLPVQDPRCLIDVQMEPPSPGPRDLLVRVRAVSVNPVDTKLRRNVAPAPGQVKVLGWDAAGVVEAIGAEVRNYREGDAVFYAGAIDRQGTNAELHVVDERIVGKAPTRVSAAEAAALPLTAITAWELLFERLRMGPDKGAGQSLLIIGGAGGVGSVLIQLARQLTQLKVIATASRPETRDWCLGLGAHAVVDHGKPLPPQLAPIAAEGVDLVASLTQTDMHLDAIVEALKPQGQLALIDDPARFDMSKLKRKSVSAHWEFMFTRSLYRTPDMDRQRELLNDVAALVDSGRLRSTASSDFGEMSAANLRRAHELIESGKACGKAVLHGYA